MSGWQEVTLQDVVTVLGDGLHGTPIYDDNGEYYFVNGNNLSNGKILLKDSTRRASEVEYLKYKKPLNNRTILLSINGTLGNVALYNNEKCFLGKSACYFNIKEDVDKQYIRYVVTNKNFQTYITEFANGTTIQNLSLKTLREFPFELPPLEEQKAIASVLSSLDDKIDLLHRQNTTLERMAETLFRQWFVEEAQADWEEVTLGDFVKINKKSINKAYPFNNIEYLDTGSLTEGKVESLQPYSIKDAPSRALRLVEHNDILISTVRPNQKHYGIINKPMENLVVSSGFCVLTCTKIAPHFVYLLLTNNEMTEFLHSIAEGSTSTYPSLKPSDIAAIAFQLPPRDKLADFAKIANDSWNKIHQNYKHIQILEKLRDNLLPKLMSGEVRINY